MELDERRRKTMVDDPTIDKGPGRIKPILKIVLCSLLWAAGLTLLLALGWLALMPDTMDMDGFGHIMMIVVFAPVCYLISFVLVLLIYTVKHFYHKRSQ